MFVPVLRAAKNPLTFFRRLLLHLRGYFLLSLFTLGRPIFAVFASNLPTDGQSAVSARVGVFNLASTLVLSACTLGRLGLPLVDPAWTPITNSLISGFFSPLTPPDPFFRYGTESPSAARTTSLAWHLLHSSSSSVHFLN